ncbi:P-loop containing nucleoside triphosphate hydrolase protein [Apodospora peruviana]|uniref:P-loop containing nucleoside triphosphate hydrolase protein n=1 Tax=Apodospora peruviana TaxID=516989 RepID=A0AAE0IIE7_9PEZI|nr:P-loop containing nucleoside triphosphate hydrolase protein [Apodospora peruviana]
MVPGAAMRRAVLLPQRAIGISSSSSANLAAGPSAVLITPRHLTIAPLSTKPCHTLSPISQGGTPILRPLGSAITPQSHAPRLRHQVRTQWASPFRILRQLSTTRPLQRELGEGAKEPATVTVKEEQTGEQREMEEHLKAHGFKRSEKAHKAAHVNMSARLSKEGKGQEGGKPGFGEVWRLIKIARPEVKWLGAAFVLLLISSGVTMSIPFSVGRILDLSTKPDTDEVRLFGLTLTQFFGSLAGLLTLGACANFGRIILLRIVGERVVSRLRTQLYRRTYVQDAEFFDANRVGDLISRLNSDTVIVGKSITQNVSDGLRSLVSGAAGFAAMAWLSPKLTSIILVMVPPIALGAFFYGRAVRNLSRGIQKNVGTLMKIAEERLGNIKTSQAFAGEVQEMGRYSKQVKKIFALGRKDAIISGIFFSTTGWAGNMTILAMLIVGGNLVRTGVMTLGDLTSFMMYTVFAGSSLFGVSGFYSELMKGVGAASRLFELQDRKPTIPSTVGLKVKSAQGPIKFSNITFAYPTRPAVTIFSGLDFEIPSGSNVCIVGPSGGGKSTVASLLLRFYNPISGSITINGVDISKMNVKSLRRRIGMVAQEPVLFSGTVAENIAYGRPRATRAEIIAAAQKANCGFISDFPEGLETQVGARGAQLSGGQKQRIAIARALLKDPDILLLDEATSALDAESETLVNAALAELLKGRSTTISIAHRLSTIKRSDQIIVLSSDGTVAEVGSYAELSANKDSAFSKLMEWQMSGSEVPASSNPHITEAEEIEEDLEEEEEDEEIAQVVETRR